MQTAVERDVDVARHFSVGSASAHCDPCGVFSHGPIAGVGFVAEVGEECNIFKSREIGGVECCPLAAIEAPCDVRQCSRCCATACDDSLRSVAPFGCECDERTDSRHREIVGYGFAIYCCGISGVVVCTIALFNAHHV